jgi:hypothetical protein
VSALSPPPPRGMGLFTTARQPASSAATNWSSPSNASSINARYLCGVGRAPEGELGDATTINYENDESTQA